MTTVTFRQFRFGPVLAATVITVLLLWLGMRTAHLLLLLFLAVLFSLYLNAVADYFARRFGLARHWAFLSAVVLTFVALAGLFWLLVPPIIEQTRQLIRVLPATIAGWEAAIDAAVARVPALQDLWGTGDHRLIRAMYDQVSGLFSNLVPKVFWIGHAFINVFSVFIMSIYLGLNPDFYREWLIALFPPIHRDLVRDVVGDLRDTLRSWIVGQLFAMFVLAVLTAVGLWYLDVPYWLTFSVFTGVVAIVPFFGTLVSTTLPALFVLGDGVGKTLAVVAWGIIVHVFEANVVVPRVMQHKVDLPPVLTIMSVLIMGTLLGPAGLLVAVPMVAIMMVVVRRILITRLYEGQGFRRTVRDNALVLRVPVADAGVLFPSEEVPDIVDILEKRQPRSA